MKFAERPLKKNSTKVINAWCSYDIANSAYNLIITTALFPIYYQEVTKQAFGGDIISFLSVQVKNTVLYDYAIAAAYFLIIFLTPLLSGIADLGGYRKRFMQIFTMMGAASCFLLYWFNGANVAFGIVLVALAVVGYADVAARRRAAGPPGGCRGHVLRVGARQAADRLRTRFGARGAQGRVADAKRGDPDDRLCVRIRRGDGAVPVADRQDAGVGAVRPDPGLEALREPR